MIINLRRYNLLPLPVTLEVNNIFINYSDVTVILLYGLVSACLTNLKAIKLF